MALTIRLLLLPLVSKIKFEINTRSKSLKGSPNVKLSAIPVVVNLVGVCQEQLVRVNTTRRCSASLPFTTTSRSHKVECDG